MINLLRALVMLSAFFHASAFAVDCYQNGKGGQTSVSATLMPFTVPSNAKLGQKIWESADIVVTVYCDNAAGWTESVTTENIHAWLMLSAFNSDYVLNNPYLTFGVTYAGVDYDMAGQGVDTGACLDKYEQVYDGVWHEPDCNGSTLQKDVTFTARFRLYVKLKAVPPTAGYTWDFGSVNVLQFDGGGGANLSTTANNLRYYINGLDNIHFLDCGVDLKISPESQIVDFGQILDNAFSKGQRIRMPFSISTIRDSNAACSEQFDVTTSFYTTDLLYDETHLDMGNGLLMRITDNAAGDITYNNYLPFAAYQSGDPTAVVTHDYTAELTPKPGSEPIAGPFSRDIIIKVNYQ
ncbi:pilus assembly protein [Enterobacter soli]|uniref:pilus assembly protein n=1 Tax=Enterobacter soli TaxID=885040 RepID=UPI0034CE4740